MLRWWIQGLKFKPKNREKRLYFTWGVKFVTIRVNITGNYLKNVFWPPPAADWCLVSNPPIRLRRTSDLRLAFNNKDRWVIRLCVKTRPRRDFDPKSYF